MVTLKPGGGRGVDHKFPREERLRGKKEIAELFEKGSAFYFKPFKTFYSSGSNAMKREYPAVLISVPKKKFQKATQRNFLKRRIREGYRLNKPHLHAQLTSRGIYLSKIGFVYVDDQVISFVQVKAAIQKIIERIAHNHLKKP